MSDLREALDKFLAVGQLHPEASDLMTKLVDRVETATVDIPASSIADLQDRVARIESALAEMGRPQQVVPDALERAPLEVRDEAQS